MTESETRLILAKCAALDNRKVTDAAIIMWFGLFRDYSYGEVEWAMMNHYSTSTEYLMPAHLLSIVNEKRAEWRMMNPVARVEKADWLEFEKMQELVAADCRDRRESGATYAVDTIDRLEIEK